ncbi:MAG TPA: heme ABC transporter ATP-binding protein [Anaerolineae bacterium]|nr:heme ABC transporter ATP-binding protein [Anaerolineae bacterium]HOQ99962.1 heme ABC transporter ATP-binding protein [Anaerolineae bacterium]HPL28197.1 heme ABC transporter ATP-binding protein [Anaerolineae bacterium]
MDVSEAARLSARDLCFGYEGQPVLHKVSLDLAPGRLLGVIGPNGAGKSTLVRLLSGLLTPQSGEVVLDGRPIGAWKPRELARRLAVVPQSPTLPETFSAGEVVLLGRSPYLGLLGNESAHDWKVARQAMERTETLHLAPRLIGTLSGGERQRVVVARALAQEAPILLLDEPTTHLDVNHQLGLIVLVRHLVQSANLAALIILHDLNLASVYCDEVVLLAGGEAVAHGAPQEVLTHDRIASAYKADVLVMAHPQTGRPIIVPEVWNTGH